MNNLTAELMPFDEMCETLVVGRSTGYKLIQSGNLKAFRIGRVWKIPRISVEEYVQQRRNDNPTQK